MRIVALRAAIVFFLLIVAIILVVLSLKYGNENLWGVSFNLAIELLGGVITVILFDIIIGSRQRKIESRNSLLRDLFSSEDEIRLLSLNLLLKDSLLEGTILNNIDFKTLNLNKKVFKKITFYKCIFFGTQLETSLFRKCDFVKCDFSGSNLNEAMISFCNFNSCEFSGTFFENSGISHTFFESCNFGSSSFVKTNIGSSQFNNCVASNSIATELNIDTASNSTFSKIISM